MMHMDFTGQSAIVTGATSGIGQAIAVGLLKRGAAVTVTATKNAPAWCAQYPLCRYRQLDVTDEGMFKTFLDEIERGPVVDILVNNAGIHCPEAIEVLKVEHWRKLMLINTEAPMRLTQSVSRTMTRGGKIVNVSSIAGVISRRGAASYSASKAALIGFTRAVAMDLASRGILVNALCPGHVNTDMMDRHVLPVNQEMLRKCVPLGRFADPGEVAMMAMFLLSSLNTYTTGQAVIVDGGVTIQ